MAEKFYICFYHDKRTYRSAHQAFRELRQINKREDDGEFRVFFCSMTGGYHHTSITQAEMDRRRVTKEGGYGKTEHTNFERQRRRFQRNPRISPKKQNRTRDV